MNYLFHMHRELWCLVQIGKINFPQGNQLFEIMGKIAIIMLRHPALILAPTRSAPNKRFNEQNNYFVRAFQIFVHFSTFLSLQNKNVKWPSCAYLENMKRGG